MEKNNKMKRVEKFITDYNEQQGENFLLELLPCDIGPKSHMSHLIIRCRPGVRFKIDKDGWKLFRVKVFCKTNQVLQVTPDPGNQNLKDLTDDGLLILMFKKDLSDFNSIEVDKFLIDLDRLLSQTLFEYILVA